MKKLLIIFITMMSIFPGYSLGQSFVTGDKQLISEFKRMLKKANNGDADAQLLIGKWYMENKVVKSDTVTAIYWLEKAGIQDNKDAVASLSEYFFDKGVWEEAEKWNLRAERLFYSLSPSSSFKDEYFESLGRLAQIYKDDRNKRYHYLVLYVNHPRNIQDFWNGEWYDALAACYRYGLGTNVNKDLADKWNAIGAISEGEESVKLLKLKYSKENEQYIFWNAIREEFKDLLLADNSQQSNLLYNWLLSLSGKKDSYKALQKMLSLLSSSNLTDMEHYIIYMSLREYYRNSNASEDELAYVEAKIDRYRPNPYPRFKMNSWIIGILVELVNKNSSNN